MSTLTPEQEGPQDQGVPASPSGCQPSASDLRSSQSGIPNAGDLAALEQAAKALLEACYLADAHEDLSSHVDGSLLDALSDALEWRYPVIWTQEQVDALNASQNGYGHPFTCGGDRGDTEHRVYADENGEDWGQLIATKRGWVCPVCDYRQFWAHGFQFSGARADPFASAMSAGTAETPQAAQGRSPASATGEAGDAQVRGE